MGATDHQRPDEALAYLREQGTALFEHAYAFDEPAITPGALSGVGVADFATPRTRVVGILLTPEMWRQLGHGRPRNPVRKLFRRAIVGLSAPHEREWDGSSGVRSRWGRDEPWDEREEVEEESIARRNDPIHRLSRVEAERWHVDLATPGELMIASADHPADGRTRRVWATLRFHDFGVRYDDVDLWALYDEVAGA